MYWFLYQSPHIMLRRGVLDTTLCFLSVTCDMSVVFSGYSGFLLQANWPPRYNWNIVESGVKQNNHNPTSNSYHVHWDLLWCYCHSWLELVYKSIFTPYSLSSCACLYLFITSPGFKGPCWIFIDCRRALTFFCMPQLLLGMEINIPWMFH
jgi:hypothetical protein